MNQRVLFAAFVLAAPPALCSAAQVQFNVTFNGGSASQRDAFTYATNIWSQHLQASYANEMIDLGIAFAAFDDPEGEPDFSTIAAASTAFASFSSDPYKLPTSLLKHREKQDFEELEDLFDGTIFFNTRFAFDYNTSGPEAPNTVDFATVALHEIGHTLGFSSALYPNGTYSRVDQQGEVVSSKPTIFDWFVFSDVDNNDLYEPLVELTDDPGADADNDGSDDDPNDGLDTADVKRSNSRIANDLYFAGPNTPTGVRLFAPSEHEPGSSYSHLDELPGFDDLMTPYYSGVDYEVSTTELAILADLGWSVVAIPEPIAFLSGLSMLGLLSLPRRASALPLR